MRDGDTDSVRLLNCGDTALVVEFGRTVDRRINDRVLSLDAQIRSVKLKGVVETVPTFRSLMIHYDPIATAAAELERTVRGLLGHSRIADKPARQWRIPVCYDAEYAPDLADVAARTGLDPADVIRLHSTVPFHVYMLGFLPGFPYLGDLPEQLVLPRRKDPRVRVPAGSVAIAMNLTVVYAHQSPGGWHLIGQTPISFFDAAKEQPSMLSAGDTVNFDPITKHEFERLASSSNEPLSGRRGRA
ncbi:MAG: 5-oxoprolinase subunit PxpB [Rhodospirillales bacterium]|nr:5-oxoprolinase subunit PxpB [Rhodospirillales bacterium]